MESTVFGTLSYSPKVLLSIEHVQCFGNSEVPSSRSKSVDCLLRKACLDASIDPHKSTFYDALIGDKDEIL